jgi:hypothetical protein
MVSSGLVDVLMCAKMHLKFSLLIVGKLFCPAHSLYARQLQEMLDTKTDGLTVCQGTK